MFLLIFKSIFQFKFTDWPKSFYNLCFRWDMVKCNDNLSFKLSLFSISLNSLISITFLINTHKYISNWHSKQNGRCEQIVKKLYKTTKYISSDWNDNSVSDFYDSIKNCMVMLQQILFVAYLELYKRKGRFTTQWNTNIG